MERPKTLRTTTVGETREKYRLNKKSFDNIMLLVSTGIFEECKEITGESVMNQALVDLIIQQEYIRERERKNWGWNKELVDFSTCRDCIL